MMLKKTNLLLKDIAYSVRFIHELLFVANDRLGKIILKQDAILEAIRQANAAQPADSATQPKEREI